MPYLRFSRDKRGYENTYVLHTFHGKRGPEPRLLYWFRTPPGARVGRHPLDEQAIRAIEASNPSLTFDWSEMLKVKPPPRPPEQRRGRPQGGRKAPREAPPAVESPPPAVAAEPPSPPVEDAAQSVPDVLPPEVELVEEEEAADEAVPWVHPVVALMGEEMLARLRARYAEIRVRIDESEVDSDAWDAARARARALNPDGWDTTEDAVRGIETFEAEAGIIRDLLGRRPSPQDVEDDQDDPPTGDEPAADDDSE